VLQVRSAGLVPVQCAGRYFNVCLKCRSVLQTLIKVPAGTLSLKKRFQLLFFVFIRLFNVVPLFMINTRYNSDLNLLKIFELIYFN
jgi:hypothetical protein